MEDDAGNVLPVPTAMRRYVQDVVLASGAPASNAYYASDGVVFENGGAVVGEARIRIPLVFPDSVPGADNDYIVSCADGSTREVCVELLYVEPLRRPSNTSVDAFAAANACRARLARIRRALEASTRCVGSPFVIPLHFAAITQIAEQDHCGWVVTERPETTLSAHIVQMAIKLSKRAFSVHEMQRELRLECALVLMAALGFSQLAGAAHHPAANAEDRAVHFGWSTETLYKDASGATLVGGLGTGVRVIKAGTQDYDAMEEAAKVNVNVPGLYQAPETACGAHMGLASFSYLVGETLLALLTGRPEGGLAHDDFHANGQAKGHRPANPALALSAQLQLGAVRATHLLHEARVPQPMADTVLALCCNDIDQRATIEEAAAMSAAWLSEKEMEEAIKRAPPGVRPFLETRFQALWRVGSQTWEHCKPLPLAPYRSFAKFGLSEARGGAITARVREVQGGAVKHVGHPRMAELYLESVTAPPPEPKTPQVLRLCKPSFVKPKALLPRLFPSYGSLQSLVSAPLSHVASSSPQQASPLGQRHSPQQLPARGSLPSRSSASPFAPLSLVALPTVSSAGSSEGSSPHSAKRKAPAPSGAPSLPMASVESTTADAIRLVIDDQEAPHWPQHSEGEGEGEGASTGAQAASNGSAAAANGGRRSSGEVGSHPASGSGTANGSGSGHPEPGPSRRKTADSGAAANGGGAHNAGNGSNDHGQHGNGGSGSGSKPSWKRLFGCFGG